MHRDRGEEGRAAEIQDTDNLLMIEIQGFRQIEQASFKVHPHHNFFFGQNGMGKSSLLEALSCLYTGKSFKKASLDALMPREWPEKSCFVSAYQDKDFLMGFQIRSERGLRALLYDAAEKKVKRIERMRADPLQSLYPQSFKEWFENPSARRNYIDWGLFHVEHSYAALWQDYMHVLKQRNILLKERASLDILRPWEDHMLQKGLIMDRWRSEYTEEMQNYWQKWIYFFFEKGHWRHYQELELYLYSGWDKKEGQKEEDSLIQALEEYRARDYILKYSSKGPHRADLCCHWKKEPLYPLLSGGQLKLFMIAMIFAQIDHLQEKIQKRVKLLWDDMPGELDNAAIERVFEGIDRLGVQSFVTGIDISCPSLLNNTYSMFHVEHGKIHEFREDRG